jgi:ABC-type lipoprotein release transport system permease subunit
MAFYLAFKEVWRNKGRFFLFSMVIALITILVLFVGGLAEGLSSANREYLDKLDADLLLFQKNVELSANSSRIGNSKLNDIRRVVGVKDIGPLGFSNGTLIFSNGKADLDVSLIGVDAGKPGLPSSLQGETLRSNRGSEIVIDAKIAKQRNVHLGDTLTSPSLNSPSLALRPKIKLTFTPLPFFCRIKPGKKFARKARKVPHFWRPSPMWLPFNWITQQIWF